MMNWGLILWLNFIVFLGGAGFLKTHKHVLVTLMSLEFLSLGVYLIIFIMSSQVKELLFFNLVYLTLLVCEGVLGISLMVSMIRNIGKETFKVMQINSW